MKKLFASIFTSKNLLQLLLAYFAYLSFNACQEIGNQYEYNIGFTNPMNNKTYEQDRRKPISAGIAAESGFNGGALGMGIICASCVMGIVFIETSKKRHNVV